METYPPDRRLVAQRVAGEPAATAEALVAAMDVLRAAGLTGAGWRAGDPGRPIEPTVPAVLAYLTEVRAARSRLEPEICALASGELLLILDSEPAPAAAIETLWFPLPPALLDADRVDPVLTGVCTAFGAFHGNLEDDRLLLAYQSERAAQRAWQATPPELRQYLPGVPELPDGVPALLVPQEYDRRRVPPGVWWVNYWDGEQVSTVGDRRVRDAGWARQHPAGDGAVTLVATDEPLDVTNPDHVARLRTLVTHLGLRDLQERNRYPAGPPS